MPYVGAHKFDTLPYQERPAPHSLQVASGYRPARIQALSDSAWSLIESCWHPDPVQRPTMADVEERLAGLLAEMEKGSNTATTSTNSSSSSSRQLGGKPGSILSRRGGRSSSGTAAIAPRTSGANASITAAGGGWRVSMLDATAAGPGAQRAAPRVNVGDAPTCVGGCTIS
jgi:hypothetical protein